MALKNKIIEFNFGVIKTYLRLSTWRKFGYFPSNF